MVLNVEHFERYPRGLIRILNMAALALYVRHVRVTLFHFDTEWFKIFHCVFGI